MSTVFEARKISKIFGPVHALRNVSIGIEAGEVHAIIGENGAGKSTLMNIFSGRLMPSGGQLFRDARPVVFRVPLDAQGAGIAIAPQEINLVEGLSVAENIILGGHASCGGAVRWKETRARAIAILHTIDETIDPEAMVRVLSKAEQQLVQIARALATEARILIFDEPTASLTSREAQKLFQFMDGFRRGGGSVFYISHRLEEILEQADRVTVLQDGMSVAQLDPRSTSKTEMINLMAGRQVKGTHEPRPFIDRTDVVLDVKGLSRQNEFRDISFQLFRGEILGVAGLIGSGRTELAKCLFGATRAATGTITLFGQDLRHHDPAISIKNGLIYLPEERKAEGIFPLLSVSENMALPSLRKFATPLGINFSRIAGEVSKYLKSLNVKLGDPRDRISTLSGGNQQKVLIGRWLLHGVRVLILDEPTRGIDVRAKFEIQRLLRSICDEGLSVIYISSELLEVLEVSDRIVVMHEGRIRGVQRANEATQESLLQQAMA